MISRFKDYDSIQVGEFRDLPNGAYVMKVLNVELLSNSQGQYLKLGCDITEGEFANYFMDDYKGQQREDKKWHCYFFLNIPKDDGSEQDGWTKKKFKRFITALEESNPGFHWNWDEQTIKGKLIGGIFNHREYRKNDGSIGKSSNFAGTCNVDAVRNGTFRPIEDKLLEGGASANTAPYGFVNIPDGVYDDELPFN